MTYEYVCTACGHQWEAEQSIRESPLKLCPNCKNETAKRQVSGGQGFILKGGGWYADGYGSKKGDGGSKTETKPETKSEPKAESKTETKTEAKTEAKTDTKSETKPKAAV